MTPSHRVVLSKAEVSKIVLSPTAVSIVICNVAGPGVSTVPNSN